MSIEEAILQLHQEQNSGTKHIIFAYWTAQAFGKEDDDDWAAAAEAGENADWSSAHESISYAMDDALTNKLLKEMKP